jgi:hypothetical protein
MLSPCNIHTNKATESWRQSIGSGCCRRDHVTLVERQIEGQITKLKLVKRQMYGRGKLDLLQARIIGLA